MNMNIKNKRRVMLIEPPFYRLYHDQQSFVKYPLPLGYLSSAVCKNTDWTVQTYNSDFNVKEKNFSPENDYITGEGFKRYLSTLKDSNLPIWNEVKQAIKDFNPTSAKLGSASYKRSLSGYGRSSKLSTNGARPFL